MITKHPLHICIFTILVILIGKTNSQFDIFKLLYDISNNFNESIPDINQFHQKYDFIIIGSGSGGSVMANRLSENPAWQILLLEVGDEESFITDVPLVPGTAHLTRYNWGYMTDRQSGACTGLRGGVCTWPKGRALGGTSVINFLIYQRGHYRDFDNWARAGNTGWSYHEILPYFIKSERTNIPELIKSPYHGTNGYLDVQYAGFKSELIQTFVNAGHQFGYKKNNDPNGATLLGFSQAQATMRNGRRCSASKAFIRPIINRSNLHISMRSWVTKILIDPQTKLAIGVEFLKNRKRYRIQCRKEVILSAGTIASPQLLLLSGVGPKDQLQSFGINVMSNLYGVGNNLQDHVSLNGLEFLVNKPITINEGSVQRPRHIFNYFYNGMGPFTIPGGALALGFVKTWNSSFENDYPDVEVVLGAGGLGGDTSGTLRNMVGLTDEFYQRLYKNVIGKPSFGMVPVLLRPKSRGRISLKSTNPFHWPRMEPNFYTEKTDLDRLIEGIRLTISLSETKSFQQLGTKFHRQPFPGCESYTFNSDAYWECCIRKYASSLQHQVGTCKMGPPNDPTAVVNDKLQVYGIGNLRVVDASIMPTIPAAHTNAAVFMIGEKAADMVKDRWK